MSRISLSLPGKNWPHFTYDEEIARDPQLSFGITTGEMKGLIASLPEENQNETMIELM